MPYIRNLDQISKRRVTLIAFPLNIIASVQWVGIWADLNVTPAH
jgi:hypothetical protein